MPSLLLQAGHHPTGGGAPGEAQWTMRCALALAEALGSVLAPIDIVGDWYGQQPPAIARKHHDLALFLHYDAAIYGIGNNTGGFGDRYRASLGVLRRITIGREEQTIEGHFQKMRDRGLELPPFRATTGTQALKEDRFIVTFEKHYVALVPIKNERRNSNTFRYYGYAATPATTPSVLIECGVGAPVGSGSFPPGQDADLLHNHLDRVVAALAVTVREFFGIPQPAPPAPLPPPIPLPPEGLMLFSDAELDDYLTTLWAQIGAPYNPDALIVKRWKEELRAGRYRGAPLSPEWPFHDGAVQRFEHGAAFYRNGQVSWTG